MKRKQVEPYLSTYLHARGRSLGVPVSGNFELTARCNFDCPMCYVHLKQEDVQAMGRELTTEQWIQTAREAADASMVFALLTGGEPFVRRDFFEIYDAMREMGLLISINSNGSMLSGEIRRRLLENPPARINISLYGGCSDTYQNMCGRDAFRQVVENIRCLRQGGITLGINLSITPYNRADIARIYEIARELDVPIRANSYMYPPIRVNGGKYGCGNRLSPEAAAEATVQWDQLRLTPEEFGQRARAMKRLQTLEGPECPMESEAGIRCRAGSTSFWMTWDGRMLPCGMMPGPEAYPLETGFAAAWDTIRRETGKLQMPAGCSSCPKRDVCAVCAAVCVTETGHFDRTPAYLCRNTDALIQKTWEAWRAKEGAEYED